MSPGETDQKRDNHNVFAQGFTTTISVANQLTFDHGFLALTRALCG